MYDTPTPTPDIIEDIALDKQLSLLYPIRLKEMKNVYTNKTTYKPECMLMRKH